MHFNSITNNSRIINSLIYHNRRIGEPIDAFSNSIAGNVSATMALNSIIQNWETYFGYENDQNILFTDPLFIDLYGMITIYRIIVQHWKGAVVDSLPDYDLDGLARISPEGSNPDLGCYENNYQPELEH